MAQANVAVVRGIYERWAKGDFAARGEMFDPGIVFVLGPDFPDAGSYVGLDELRQYMRGFLEPWVRLTIEVEEIRPAGDTVLAAVRQRGTGGESGVATELPYFQVWWFRGDRVVRLENFRHEADALEAAGVVE
jgi:ketosteroid isomerase-like protein